MERDQEKFDPTKAEAENFYKTINSVRCPYLEENVAFNAKGLEHVKFKERGKARLLGDQYVRLRLLKLAPEVLRSSHTLQEYFETKRFEQQSINSRWESRMVRVTYWRFVAIIKNARMKIIVKQVEGGKKFFWSLIPFWKNDYKNSPENKKILHAGDLETD